MEGTTHFSWRGHLLPAHLGKRFPFYSAPLFPSPIPKASSANVPQCPLVVNVAKLKVPPPENPLGQGTLMSGCRQVAQLTRSRSSPKMHFPDRAEFRKHGNRSITHMWVPPTSRGELGTMELQAIALMLNQAIDDVLCLHLWLLRERSTCEWHLQNSSWSSLLTA